MSHVALVRFDEPAAPDGLAGLIRQQMLRRFGAMTAEAGTEPGRPDRSREWKILAGALWRMAADAARSEAAVDRLPWTRSAAHMALPGQPPSV